jgi:Fe-S cluster biogenesis protein NfuA
MPKIVEIADTPNPNAKKFTLDEPLSWGETYSFENVKEAKDNALAAALFDIEDITNVFYVDHWLTVTKSDEADWLELVSKVSELIIAAPAAEQLLTATEVEKTTAIPGLNSVDQHRFDNICILIDEQIRPALQGDGGDLSVVGLDGNQLSVHYQGACGSCPSALSGTLRGIEGLVKTIEPNIEVVAV